MIGRRGEKRFDVMCSDAGVTCNRSIEDDYGWDKLIEFPQRLAPYAAIDMQPQHVMAAVQLKTTEKPTRSVRISLSNALRYAKSDLPQFIVLVALDGPQPRFFARHVWGALIAERLKSGRQADAEGVTAPHKRSVSLSFGPEDERGPGVLDWIRSEVEAVSEPYAATKRRFVDLVGFEQGYGTARMTLSLQSEDELLEVQLGLRPEVDATRFSYTSERFGIPARRPEIDEENVRIHVTPEGRGCTLRLEFTSGVGVSVPARLYSASVGKTFAIRVASRPLDITAGPRGRIRVKASLRHDDRARLEELSAFAHLLASKPGEAVNLHANLDGRELDLGSVNMQEAGQSEAWGWLALGTDVARAIARDAGRDLGEFQMQEVQNAAGELEIMAALASDRAISLEFSPEPEAPAKFDGFLAYASAGIGNEVFSAVTHRPLGVDDMHDGRRRVVFGPGRIVWCGMSKSETWREDVVVNAYRRHLDRLSASAELMAMGDLAKLVSGGTGDRELTADLPSGRECGVRRPVAAKAAAKARRARSPGRSIGERP